MVMTYVTGRLGSSSVTIFFTAADKPATWLVKPGAVRTINIGVRRGITAPPGNTAGC